MVTRIRAVIDTNVVFEGLTHRGGPAGVIVSAWMAELFQSCVSQSLAYEYTDVLARKLAPERWARIRFVLDALLHRAEPVTTYYSWRPSSPDPGDEHVVDCAMNARALVVTSNLRDFELARVELQLPVFSPVDFLTLLQAETQTTVSKSRR
jgi:predicted nucleic acid-binding protein